MATNACGNAIDLSAFDEGEPDSVKYDFGVKIVYQLYGLTEEEIRIVEGKD